MLYYDTYGGDTNSVCVIKILKVEITNSVCYIMIHMVEIANSVCCIKLLTVEITNSVCCIMMLTVEIANSVCVIMMLTVEITNSVGLIMILTVEIGFVLKYEIALHIFFLLISTPNIDKLNFTTEFLLCAPIRIYIFIVNVFICFVL